MLCSLCTPGRGFLFGVLVLGISGHASAQTSPASPASTNGTPETAVAPQENAPSAASSAGFPAAPPAASPQQQPATVPVARVPPGYMLVPIPPPAAPPATREQAMELPYEEGQAIPPGYRLSERPRRGLIIAGSIVTGVPWLFSVTGAVAADFDDKSGFLLIPALGPWLTLAAGGGKDERCADDGLHSCDPDRAGLRAVLVLDALVQSAGAAMFIVGIATKSKRLVRTAPYANVVPLRFGEAGYGLGLRGAF